ncbi:hypothetical protein [Streptomyces sp. NPDC090994]|uniref:hypothetical protein n=1 Tax=Streptomyces sp. NPDC090994 TaxID=3365969 RepID=UPI0037FAD437
MSAYRASSPLLGRDRELGTHRMVLAQGVGRAQWFTTRLALAALSTVTLSGILAWLFHWWWQPAADHSYGLFRYETTALSGSGPSAVAAALFGLATGALAGLLTRRVLSAMAWTLSVTALSRTRKVSSSCPRTPESGAATAPRSPTRPPTPCATPAASAPASAAPDATPGCGSSTPTTWAGC